MHTVNTQFWFIYKIFVMGIKTHELFLFLYLKGFSM